MRVWRTGHGPPVYPPLPPPPVSLAREGGRMPESLLTTAEAATILGTSPRTLEDWRFRGGGPVYRKVGRRLVRYSAADLERFLADGARTNTGGGSPG